MVDFSPHYSNLTGEMQWWLNQILELMMARSGMSQSDAINAMLRSYSLSAQKPDLEWLLRESPFYWAMQILQGLKDPKDVDSPYWWTDPQINEEYEKYDAWLSTLSDEQCSVNFE